MGSQTCPSSSAISVVTGSPAPTATNSKTKKTLAVGGKIVIGLAVLWPIITGLASLRLLHRRRKAKNASGAQSTPSQNEQPYLQQKGELEAEERMRFELYSESVRPELEGENEIHEICIGAASGKAGYQGSICRPELRGDEHSKELE